MESHPVDTLIDQTPIVARLHRNVRRLAARMNDEVVDRKLWIAYSDTLLALRSERETLFYDAGYEHGLVAGNTLSAETNRHQRARAFARRLQGNAVATGLPRPTVVAVLLETARALALGGLSDNKRRGLRRPEVRRKKAVVLTGKARRFRGRPGGEAGK